jgi:pseudouridine-5'-phosphate glycosidase
VRSPLAVAPGIAEAIGKGRPVVALETTVVTHGLPHPDGLEAAAAMERAVRAAGALPALIGILDGQARVGVSEQELQRLAASPAWPR